MDIATLAIKIDSTDAPRAANDMDKVTASGARLEAQTHKATASAEKLGTAVGGVARGGLAELSSRAGVAGNALGSFGTAGLVAAGALGAVVVALQAARKALAFGDEIADQATKLAVSTKALQEYRYAVHALGGEYKDADAALAGFQTTFGLAQAGFSKRATKPFEALGLDAASFRNTEDALDAVIDKIANLASDAEQAAIAEKLGISAMLPAIRAGTDRIDELRAAASRLGYVMDDEVLQKASGLNDELEDMQAVIGVQLATALVRLGPTLVDIAGFMADFAKATAGAVGWLIELDEKSKSWAVTKFLNGEAPGDAGIRRMLGADGPPVLSTRSGGRGSYPSRTRTGRLGGGLDDDDAGGGGSRGDTAAARAMRERAAAAKQLADEIERAAKSDADYIEGLKDQQAQLGKTDAEIRLMAAGQRINEAMTRKAGAATQEWADAALELVQAIEQQRAALERWNAVVKSAAQGAEWFQGELERINGAISDASAANDNWAEQLRLESSLIGAGNRERTIAIAQLQAMQDLRGGPIDPNSNSGAQIIADRVQNVALDFDIRNKDKLARDFGRTFADGVEAAFDGSLGSFLKRTFKDLFKNTLGSIVQSLAGNVLGGSSAMGGGGAGGLMNAGSAVLGLGSSIATGWGVATSGATTAALAGTAGSVGGGAMAGIGAALASNPVGWAIAGAGLVAGVLGIFGGGGKKKKEAMEAEAARAQAELNALTEAGTELHDQLAEAYERESDALQDTIDKFEDFAKSLGDFRRELDTGPAALLSPEAQYNANRAAFTDTAAKARLGDPDALGDLQRVSQDYLDASRSYYASSGRYFADLADVKAAVEAAQGTAQRTADNAKTELDVLKQSVAGLLDINESVISVREAIEKMNGDAAGGPNYAGYVTGNPDLKAEYLRSSAQFGSVAAYGQWHWENFGSKENRSLPGAAPTPTTGTTSTTTTPATTSNDNAVLVQAVQGVSDQIAKLGEAVVASDQRSAGAIVTALDNDLTQRLAAGGSVG